MDSISDRDRFKRNDYMGDVMTKGEAIFLIFGVIALVFFCVLLGFILGYQYCEYKNPEVMNINYYGFIA